MPSRRERKRKTFSSPAVLEGMGYRAECVVMGTRETVGEQTPRLIRLSITREPAHMLDGPYNVRFGAESAHVERKGGLWVWIRDVGAPGSAYRTRKP